MKDLFLLSGLGADKRVYDFLDLGNHNIHHIQWISPMANETLQQYAGRLCEQIHVVKPVLIGVSFGGMVAMEIGKIIPTEKIILISSAQTGKDIPAFFKFTGKLRLHYTVPSPIMASNNPVTSWIFGARTKMEKELLTSILIDTDESFLRWAIDKIVRWNNSDRLQNVTRIHGTNDKVLPFTEAHFKIEGGEHLMVINRAPEVSAAIRKTLAD